MVDAAIFVEFFNFIFNSMETIQHIEDFVAVTDDSAHNLTKIEICKSQHVC